MEGKGTCGGGGGTFLSSTSSPVLVSYMCQLSVKEKGAASYNMPLSLGGKGVAFYNMHLVTQVLGEMYTTFLQYAAKF